MHILLTNDDGVHAPGLTILAETLARVATVTVVAPDSENSGISHALSLNRPLRIRQWDAHTYSVDGTPTDTIFVGLCHILKEQQVDLVVSGINPGPNMGCDVTYSGTVGGALEGSLSGLPAIAVSLGAYSQAPQHFQQAADVVAELVQRGAWQQWSGAAGGSPIVLNVNVPLELAEPRTYEVTTLERHRPKVEIISKTDPRGKGYVWIGGVPAALPSSPGSDRYAVGRGHVSLTALHLWGEVESFQAALREWFA